jgi:hypothetical protein
MASRKKLIDPSSTEPFPLSRSKLECWIKCPRCFWLDRRLGIRPPLQPVPCERCLELDHGHPASERRRTYQPACCPARRDELSRGWR